MGFGSSPNNWPPLGSCGDSRDGLDRAALDDANVERFVKLIRRYSSDEQFIVVTHHKHTMETADKLIGVVGRPKGVSNLLAVDIKQARKLVDKTVA